MASNQAGSSTGASTGASAGASASSSAGSSAAKEYTVRVPKGINKKFSILKFNPANNVDFQNCGGARLERENNFREYKMSYDIDVMPKFGAGSEYGRDQKDEARRKKFGIVQKKYNPDNQPWIIKTGADKKQARKFKGVRGGGLLENASYYVFTQSPDGSFEAFPLKEWYNFMPVAKYKALNADEAEEQFEKRDRTLNYFSVMLQKRLKNEDIDDVDLDGEGEKKTKKKKNKKDFKLTELDEWAELSDDDSESDASEGGEDKPKKKKEPKDKKKATKKSKKKDRDVDEEASEDSDDLDEGAEVDYMTDTDSEDDDMHKKSTRDKSDKYADKGVEDEDGLRKDIATDDEDEDEEKKDDNKEEEEEDKDTDKPKKDGDSDSESSDSGSDSDPEKDTNLSSALFLQKKDKPKSRSNTPTLPGEDGEKKSKKRKNADGDSPLPKKSKTDSRSSTPTPGASAAAVATPVTLTPLTGTDATIEEAVKRYLSRKPMPIKDLLQKVHKSMTNISKETLTKTVPLILKRLNPEKRSIGGVMHLQLKKT